MLGAVSKRPWHTPFAVFRNFGSMLPLASGPIIPTFVIVSQNIIGAAPLLPPGTSHLPSAPALQAALSFAYFDRLYAQTPEQYAEMLDLYAHEYVLYRNGIDDALTAADEPALRRIKHKIIYSLHLLELSGMHHNLEALAHRFATMDGFERAQARQAYDAAFDLILMSITEQRNRVS